MSIFRLVSKIGAIFLTSLLCSKSKAKQPFRFGATPPNSPGLLQLQTYALFSPWSIFSKSNGFAPTPNICPLFPLEHLLQIYRLCSNSRHMSSFSLGASSPNLPALLQFQAYALFSSWSIFSKPTDFAPTPDICPLFPLEHLLQIYRLCSNSRHMSSFSLGASSPNLPALLQFPMPHIAPKKDKARGIATGLCLQFENRYFICFHLLLTCLYYNMHKEFCTFF